MKTLTETINILMFHLLEDVPFHEEYSKIYMVESLNEYKEALDLIHVNSREAFFGVVAQMQLLISSLQQNYKFKNIYVQVIGTEATDKLLSHYQDCYVQIQNNYIKLNLDEIYQEYFS